MIKFIRHGRAGPDRLLGLTRNVRDTMVRGVLRNYRHSSTAWLSTARRPYTMARVEWALGRQAVELQIQSLHKACAFLCTLHALCP